MKGMMFLNSIIPFQKELKFDTQVKEITSISLEREFEIREDEIKGNLFVTGEYKSHEISANVIPFSFKIPFTIAISNDLVKESIHLEIHDFAYEMKGIDQIQVSIELELSGDMKEEKEETIEPSENEILEIFEEPVLREESSEVLELGEKGTNEDTELVNMKEENLILNQVSNESEYVTYHVHIVEDSDSIESICTKYQVTPDLLREYNSFTELSKGDKLLIPVSYE